MSDALNVDRLLAVARDKTGLDDFGDEWFMEPLRILLDSIADEAKLNEQGKFLTEARFKGLLAERLRLRALQAKNPEILDEEVVVATEICGLPRTGSTLLHRLLAASPEVTSTISWETTYPLPFPGETAGEIRQEKAEARMKMFMEFSPDFGDIHTIAWDEPEEDILLLDRTFISQSFDSFYQIPTYGLWMREFDQAPAYDELKQWLQVLQWQDPGRQGKPWVLKSPHHLTAVDTVLDTFDDCRLVMTHRDPVKAVPSFASMVSALCEQHSDAVDREWVGRYWRDRFVDSLSKYVEARDRRPERFIDVRFEDTVSDSAGTAERVAGLLAIPYDAAAVDAYIQKNQSQRHGSHSYTPEEFGLDAAGLESDFSFYMSKVAP